MSIYRDIDHLIEELMMIFQQPHSSRRYNDIPWSPIHFVLVRHPHNLHLSFIDHAALDSWKGWKITGQYLFEGYGVIIVISMG